MKKGVMFSFIMFFLAVTFVGLIALQRSMISTRRKELSISVRINDMMNMYDSILRDMGKALNIVLKRAISVSISHVVNEGKGLDQADSILVELLINGTLNGTPQELMKNTTIPDWINKMILVGDLKGYDINITIENLEIKPYDSWNLVVVADVHINITDQFGIANLVRTTSINELVPIEEFEDPLFPLNTNGRGFRIIQKSPHIGNYTRLLVNGIGDNGWKRGLSVVKVSSDVTGIQDIENKNEKILITDHAETLSSSLLNSFKGIVSENDVPVDVTTVYVKDANNAMNLIPSDTYVLVDGNKSKVWYVENLREDVQNSYYHPSTNGPSFLDRLEGSLTCNYCSGIESVIGLESFVNKNYLLSLDIPVSTELTDVDYLYFSIYAGYAGEAKGVKGLEDLKFKIDNEDSHQEVYNVTQLLI